MDPEVHEQCVRETVRLLQGLTPALPPDETVARRLPWTLLADGGVTIHRGESVHPIPERYAPGTNRSEDIGYGVQVTHITPKPSSLSDGFDPTARKTRIRRRFVHQKPATLQLTDATYVTTTVEAGKLFDAPKGLDKYEVSSIVIRYWIRETRVTN